MHIKIKELRKTAKLTQHELAQKIGIGSVTTIRNWESGVTGSNTWELAAVLSKVSEKTLEDIAGLMPTNPASKDLLLAARLCEALRCRPEDLISHPSTPSP